MESVVAPTRTRTCIPHRNWSQSSVMRTGTIEHKQGPGRDCLPLWSMSCTVDSPAQCGTLQESQREDRRPGSTIGECLGGKGGWSTGEKTGVTMNALWTQRALPVRLEKAQWRRFESVPVEGGWDFLSVDPRCICDHLESHSTPVAPSTKWTPLNFCGMVSTIRPLWCLLRPLTAISRRVRSDNVSLLLGVQRPLRTDMNEETLANSVLLHGRPVSLLAHRAGPP